MLPVEVRIYPTYKVVSDLQMPRHLCRADPAVDRIREPARCCSGNSS